MKKLLLPLILLTGCASSQHRPDSLQDNCRFILKVPNSYAIYNTSNLYGVYGLNRQETLLVLTDYEDLVELNVDAAWLQIYGQCKDR
jgi:hypothetical protein